MTPAECEEAIRSALPGFSFERVTGEYHGWSFWTFVVDGEWIFRFPRRDGEAQQLEREFILLPTLAARLPAAIPRYDYRGEWNDRPFGGYRLIEGAPVKPPPAPGDATLAREIGELLTALHNFPTEMAASRWSEADPGARWLKQQRAFQAECAERAFPVLSPRDRMVASDLFRRFNRELCNTGAGLTVAHCDLGLEHVLGRDGHVSGVIDWSDAAIGDPAIDFAGILGSSSSQWLHLVVEYYDRPTGDHFMARVQYYHRVAPLHDVLHGLSIGDRSIVKAGAKEFARRTR